MILAQWEDTSSIKNYLTQRILDQKKKECLLLTMSSGQLVILSVFIPAKATLTILIVLPIDEYEVLASLLQQQHFEWECFALREVLKKECHLCKQTSQLSFPILLTHDQLWRLSMNSLGPHSSTQF